MDVQWCTFRALPVYALIYSLVAARDRAMHMYMRAQVSGSHSVQCAYHSRHLAANIVFTRGQIPRIRYQASVLSSRSLRVLELPTAFVTIRHSYKNSSQRRYKKTTGDSRRLIFNMAGEPEGMVVSKRYWWGCI